MFKLIALDLDDTLLNDDRKISIKNRLAIIAAQKIGVKIALCSGRPISAMYSLAKELKLAEFGGFLIAFNGAKIYNCQTKETLFSQNLSSEELKYIYQISLDKNLNMQTYIGDEIVANQANKYTDIESEITGLPIRIVQNYQTVLNEPTVKVILLGSGERLKTINQELTNNLDYPLSMMISKPFFLEFMNKSVDKGQSLTRLANKLKIPINQVMVFGDSYNDMSMMKINTFAVAMENAVTEIKAISNEITASNNHDGVAKTLKKHLPLTFDLVD